jgi:pimeloyl-ACP methyl ester carboxylesterase
MTAPIRNSRIRLSQGQVFGREAGQGSPVVFLHGSWGEGSQWLPVMQELSHQYHCIAPDLLGFGDSERPKIHYSIELQVECLTEYLEALKLRQVHLVGYEVGGWIAASYGLRFPNQIKSLTLLNAEGVEAARSGQRWRLARWLMRQPPLFYWFLRLLDPLFRCVGQTALQRPLAQHQQLQQSPVACQLLFRRRSAEIRAELLQDRVGWLKFPILILQGECDRSSHSAKNQIYAQAPQSTLQAIAGADHNFLQTHADRTAEHILRFLQSTDEI